MNIFDILGPVMVGPSSSHTAGAVRIGLAARKLLGGEPSRALLRLHGSFATTGIGHGTDKALVAGLLGMSPADPRIPESFSIARERGLSFSFTTEHIRGAHPNSVLIDLEDRSGRSLEVGASSLGGGRIKVFSLDGLETSFTGELPTLIIQNSDRPGCVSQVTKLLAECGVNIATLRLNRGGRGGTAVMVIECDQPAIAGAVEQLRELPGILSVGCYLPEEDEYDNV